MKGGKKGRDPKTSGGRQAGARGKPKKGAAKGAAKHATDDLPPKKGARKKPGYGGSSSADDA